MKLLFAHSNDTNNNKWTEATEVKTRISIPDTELTLHKERTEKDNKVGYKIQEAPNPFIAAEDVKLCKTFLINI